MAQIIPTGDTILQAWRFHKNPATHVSKLLKYSIGNVDFGKHTIDVFDVGCGTGEFLWHVKNSLRSAEVSGCNFFDTQAQIGRSCGINITTCDFMEMPIVPESMDIVFCNYTLGYFDQPTEVLKKIHTMLRPKGRLVMWDCAASTMLCSMALGYHLRPIAAIKKCCDDARFIPNLYVGKAKLSKSIKQIASKQQLKIFKDYSLPVLTVGVKK
ncbi:MAG: class I SAM-dependent methyltransferase [Duodenibacillus sp.]